MPDDGRQIVEFSPQQLQAMPFNQALEYWVPNLAGGLPDHIPVERFKRVLITAVSTNPDLAAADRRSLFNACARCAHDGLYPDGREAALVVYNTKLKKRVRDQSTGEFLRDQEGKYIEREGWAQMVQYMPMIAGIRKRMRNTGQVLSADAEVVYSRDEFLHRKGDNPNITHNPPPLGQDRGSPIGAYAIIKLANGEVLREVMPKTEIEHIRDSFSKAPKSPAWVKTPDEMWRKTVLRRCSKAAPSGSDLDVLLNRDEELDRPDEHSPMREIPPPPDPRDYMAITDERDDETGDEQTETHLRFEVFDSVGVLLPKEFATEMEAMEALADLIGQERSLSGLEGLGESNPTLSRYAEIIEAYKDRKEALSNPNPGNRQDRPAAGAQPQIDPARGVTDTADQVRTEHPEGESLSSQTERPRDAAKSVAHAPRDEAFWSQKKYVLPETSKPKELLYYLGQYLRQCRDQFDINGLEADNAVRFSNLLGVDHREATEMIAQRRKEIG
jgi:recombinational DNA repair protein RecT